MTTAVGDADCRAVSYPEKYYRAAKYVDANLEEVAGVAATKAEDEEAGLAVKLMFYALRQQVDVGACTESAPWRWDVEARAKHDMWVKLGNMSKMEAMYKYVVVLEEAIGGDHWLDWKEGGSDGQDSGRAPVSGTIGDSSLAPTTRGGKHSKRGEAGGGADTAAGEQRGNGKRRVGSYSYYSSSSSGYSSSSSSSSGSSYTSNSYSDGGGARALQEKLRKLQEELHAEAAARAKLEAEVAALRTGVGVRVGGGTGDEEGGGWFLSWILSWIGLGGGPAALEGGYEPGGGEAV